MKERNSIQELKTTMIGLVALSLLYLTSGSNVTAQPNHKYVALYNWGPLEATLNYRVGVGELPDKNCGDPTITGYIGLHEKSFHIPYGSSTGSIVFIKETDPNSDHQIHKLCVMDVVDDDDVRDINSIADVDPITYQEIYPNTGLEMSFIPPDVIEPPRPVPQRISPDLSPYR